MDLQSSTRCEGTSCKESAYIWLNTPVPIKILQTRVLIEEPAIPATHVTIADHPSFPHADRTQILETVHEATLVDPVRQGPVLFPHDLIIAWCESQILGCSLCSFQYQRPYVPGSYLELFAKRLIVKENPRVVVFAIPVVLQLPHTLHQPCKLRIPHQTN